MGRYSKPVECPRPTPSWIKLPLLALAFVGTVRVVRVLSGPARQAPSAGRSVLALPPPTRVPAGPAALRLGQVIYSRPAAPGQLQPFPPRPQPDINI